MFNARTRMLTVPSLLQASEWRLVREPLFGVPSSGEASRPSSTFLFASREGNALERRSNSTILCTRRPSGALFAGLCSADALKSFRFVRVHIFGIGTLFAIDGIGTLFVIGGVERRQRRNLLRFIHIHVTSFWFFCRAFCARCLFSRRALLSLLQRSAGSQQRSAVISTRQLCCLFYRGLLTAQRSVVCSTALRGVLSVLRGLWSALSRALPCLAKRRKEEFALERGFLCRSRLLL